MSTSSTENDELDLDDTANGGTGDQEGADRASATDDQDAQGGDHAADLGDAGKKALDAMKAKWRAERDARKAAEDKLAAAAKPKADDDDAPDLDAIRAEARAEVAAESLRDKALDKLEAKAARLFQNPEDARAFLAAKVDDFIDDGKVDIEAITDALADLLTERPYLGVTQGDTKRFQGTGDGGPKGNAGKPQITEAQLKNMTPEQIVQAQNDGQLTTLLGG